MGTTTRAAVKRSAGDAATDNGPAPASSSASSSTSTRVTCPACGRSVGTIAGTSIAGHYAAGTKTACEASFRRLDGSS